MDCGVGPLGLDRDALEHLARAVGAEVEAHEDVAVGDAAVGEHTRRKDELVLLRLLKRILVLDHLLDTACSHRLALAVFAAHDVVRLLHTLPALVAVHRVVPPDDRRDLAVANLCKFLFEQLHVAGARSRRRVAAIHAHMEERARYARLLCRRDDRVQMLLVAVHATVAQQPPEVKAASARLCSRKCIGHCLLFRHISVLNGQVDLH